MCVYTYITLFPIGIRQAAGIWYKLTVRSVGTSLESVCAERTIGLGILLFFFFLLLQNVEYTTRDTLNKDCINRINFI